METQQKKIEKFGFIPDSESFDQMAFVSMLKPLFQLYLYHYPPREIQYAIKELSEAISSPSSKGQIDLGLKES